MAWQDLHEGVLEEFADRASTFYSTDELSGDNGFTLTAYDRRDNAGLCAPPGRPGPPPEKLREAARLVSAEGLSMAEAARRTGLTRDSVRYELRRSPRATTP